MWYNFITKQDPYIIIKKRKKRYMRKASIKDVKELKEEGIETQMIPWIEDKNN